MKPNKAAPSREREIGDERGRGAKADRAARVRPAFASGEKGGPSPSGHAETRARLDDDRVAHRPGVHGTEGAGDVHVEDVEALIAYIASTNSDAFTYVPTDIHY